MLESLRDTESKELEKKIEFGPYIAGVDPCHIDAQGLASVYIFKDGIEVTPKEEQSKYQVWLEGYAATGESGTAMQLNLPNEDCTLWEGGVSFRAACLNALETLKWEIDHYYDYARNTYWGCRFFDNEQDARKTFG